MNKRGFIVRAMEGRYVWGDFRVSTTARDGWVTYHLSVYPPGTNSTERRLLQFWHSWPVVGALLSLFALITVGHQIGPATLVPAAIVLYLAGIVTGWVLTRRLRPRVIRMNVAQFPENGDMRTLGDLAALSKAVHRLRSMDARRALDTVSELDYEQEWWSIYELLHAASVAEQRPRVRITPKS